MSDARPPIIQKNPAQVLGPQLGILGSVEEVLEKSTLIPFSRITNTVSFHPFVLIYY